MNTFETYQPIVIENLWRLLRAETRYVIVRVFFLVRVSRLTILALFQEFQGFGEIKDGQAVLMQFEMNDTEIVEIVLWVV